MSDNQAETALTADQLEAIFHQALGDGDVKGVEISLTLMASADPKRAQRLYHLLDLALVIHEAQRDPSVESSKELS